MRNIPLSFLAEETLSEITRQHQSAPPNTEIKVAIDTTLAERHAGEIQDHKWFLSERLGRDVGNKVAALDYLENIYQIAGTRPASLRHRVLAAIESALESDAMQGLVYSQIMVRGLPGSHRDEDFFPPVYTESKFKVNGINRLLVEKHWDGIQAHKWLMSERLGRDVGNKVAALDYSETVSLLTGSTLDNVKNFARNVWNNLLSSLDADGPNSIANFERMMRGSRSLAK